MATQTVAESAATNYAAQAGVAASLTEALRRLWDATVDLANLTDSIALFTRGAVALVSQYSSATRSLAIGHYMDVRRLEGVREPYRPPLVDLPPAEQVEALVNWATGQLWSKEGGTLVAPATVEQSFDTTAESLAKTALNVGRDQVIEATEKDRTAIAWAREARPDACWFCAMLAARGAVYTSAEAAGQVKAGDVIKVLGMPAGDDAKGFVNRYHLKCRCQVVPVFNRYEATADVREWQRIWNESTKGKSGMKAKQKAFRDALAKHRAGGGGEPPSDGNAGLDSDEPDEYRNIGETVPFRPSERPNVFDDGRAREHILERHGRGGTDGTQFPEDWSEEEVFRAVDDVLRDPAMVKTRGQFLNFYGTHRGLRVEVQLMRETNQIRTAHPIDGPGVTRKGEPVRLPKSAYAGIRWTHEQ